MSKIAVVGYGWLGLAFAKTMQEAGYVLCGTSTRFEKITEIKALGMEAIRLDVSELQTSPIDPVFFTDVSHCLLNIPPSKTKGISYADACAGVVSLFPNTCKFVFAGTTGVYQDLNQVVTEGGPAGDFMLDHPVFQAEKQLTQVLGKRLSIVRFAGLIGPGRNPARFFSGKKQVPNGAAPVNLIQQSDAVEIVKRIIEQDRFGEHFLACGDEHPEKQLFYCEACRLSGMELPEFLNEKMAFKIIDNSKSKKELGMQYSPLLP